MGKAHTPTTFEKVDQTFIIAWQSSMLNHNLLLLSSIKNRPYTNFHAQMANKKALPK